MTDRPSLPRLKGLTPDQILLVDELCLRFEHEWKAGRQPRLDEYLEGLGEPAGGLARRALHDLEQWLASQTRITLVVTAGAHEGRQFSFAGHDTFIVGRSRRAHFRLPIKDRSFSRIHFLIEVNPPQCRLLDLHSRNGTYVNGQKVVQAELHAGDEIRAGRTLLRVCVQTPGDEPVSETETPSAGPFAPTALPEPPEKQAAPGAAPGPGGGPVALPSTPPGRSEGAPVAAPGSVPLCRVCAAPLETPVPEPASPGSAPGLPLCTACQQHIAQRRQPIPGYLLVRELGRGGMGIVYLAFRPAAGIPVALKVITPAAAGSAKQIQRFLREADILRQLDHPHIVRFLDLGEVDGRLYFVMEYVPGTDAGKLVQSQGPLPVGRAVGLIGQLLEALEYAHARGFVHRDIKPANLLVERAGRREIVLLADFGLARVYQGSALSGLTMTGDVGGTAAFMAPEQLSNFREASPAADQYAAGATLYWLLTGQSIYDLPPEFGRRLLMVLEQPPVAIQARRPDLPRDLALAIHRTLAKEPGKRFADVTRLRLALAPFADG